MRRRRRRGNLGITSAKKTRDESKWFGGGSLERQGTVEIIYAYMCVCLSIDSTGSFINFNI